MLMGFCRMVFAAGFVSFAAAADVTGPPEVIDGDSLEVAGQRFQLHGIDAPEPGELCTKPNGKTVDCGRIARAALLDLTAGFEVSCQPEAAMDDKSTDGHQAVCSAGGFSLNRNTVYTGWAVADPEDAKAYLPVEREAKVQKRGLWQYGIAPPPWLDADR